MPRKKPAAPQRPKRSHRLVLKLSDREYKALCDHCHEHKIESSAVWIRKLLLREILSESMRSAPLLFDEEEMSAPSLFPLELD